LVAAAEGTALAQGAAGTASGNVTFGAEPAAGASMTGGGAARAPEGEADQDPQRAWAEREAKLNEAATITGGVGLLHTQHAQGGAPGQFRVGFTTEYFSSSFLCSADFPCRDPRNASNLLQSDSADHIGGRLTLSMQILSWLETYLGTSAIANSNPANRPSLLQVLGDSVLGGKAHGALSKVFHVGGAFELWLVNGTGAVGLDGGGTSAKFRLLGTADLRGMEKPLPLRFSMNTTYVLDNSGEVVTSTETARGTPITRIERFGLDINRVDHFDFHLGAELFAAEEKVRPFLEYVVNVPFNRQSYQCHPNNPSGDKCLKTDGFAPSSLTLGSRFYPWKKGFNLTAALDIGISGVNFFIEEVRPTPPWMLYLGAGWAFDTQDKPPVIKDRLVETRAVGRKIRGFVHEDGQSQGIANAIVAWDNHPELTSLATGSDGRFTTHDLTPGNYAFSIQADGYKPGQCSAMLTVPAAPAPSPRGAPPPQQPEASGDLQVDCTLQALPRVGNIVGKVKDLETGQPVGTAAIKIVDVSKKELTGSVDANGAFRFELVTPGEAAITADAEGYLVSSEKLEVKVRQDNPIEISLRKKPKNALVTVQNKEIIIRQQIQFAVDSATILPASSGLLTEIADVLLKNQRIRKVEVQGHTDGTGTPAHNMTLSEERAASVVAWLTAHGVAADRLTAKGYGDTKPLVPNVTELNKQRNRRVQFIIQEQDVAPAATPLGPPALGSGAIPRKP
jgi:outer membrane protein OmpA-like peptidoglycan-associated protein